ncbi:unnamed protein product [Zymoseptoria tritici ST99CH_1A5]|uniref:Uncharacterized protein n=1 Tax=Zymoseptoria tritici ST99CH_1A5 TaxID=1276529 RepID=A0A1Y6LNA2_ZYMTR|nr:unnamed protein product [Zymoseptoria tritici ST99CH_1A5]
MPPTKAQLDQWRKEFEAARSFEDDDMWLPPSPKTTPSTRNTAPANLRTTNQPTTSAPSHIASNAPRAGQPPTAPSFQSNHPPANTNIARPPVYNSYTRQWIQPQAYNGTFHPGAQPSVNARRPLFNPHDSFGPQSDDARNGNGDYGGGSGSSSSNSASGQNTGSPAKRPE